MAGIVAGMTVTTVGKILLMTGMITIMMADGMTIMIVGTTQDTHEERPIAELTSLWVEKSSPHLGEKREVKILGMQEGKHVEKP